MIPYVLHVALLISVCLLFYKLLLQKETFYRLNRVVLIFCLALSFVLPLIPVPRQWAFRESTKPVVDVAQPITANQPVISPAVNVQTNVNLATSTTAKAAPAAKIITPAVTEQEPLMQRIVKWAFYLYWIGVAAFGLNLLLQIVVLLYQAYTRPVIKDGKFRIIELSGDKAPCSFGNNIFINPEKYDWETYSQILLHEKIHIQQGHSLDILIAELVLVLQWFNPFAWLYRTELENNLEFLTDDAVLGHEEIERASYQMSLLKVSAPHLSLGITTNYNQSLLKKRIIMMNSKRSNIHIMWKYFFLVPLLGVLACALNDPAAYSAPANTKSNYYMPGQWAFNTGTEGSWFATIKGDKIKIEFRSDSDDHNSSSNSDFNVNEFSSLPRNNKSDFTLTREAGSVLFNGKFDGNQGYGHYKFTASKNFKAFLSQHNITDNEEGDDFAFFVINIKKEYVLMLENHGYKGLSKDQLIAMGALRVDEAYILLWKNAGYNHLTSDQLVSGKALGINGAYLSEIQKAGYNHLSFDQLVSFKATGVTGKYITGLHGANARPAKPGQIAVHTKMDAEDVISVKALNVDANYIDGIRKEGYTNVSLSELTSMKAVGVTPAFIEGFRAMGYKNIPADELISLKSLGVNGDYLKSFSAIGYKNISSSDLSSMKATGVTPEFAESFKSIGYKNIPVEDLVSLKALGITPEYAKSFESAGYKNIPYNDLTSIKALGITPEFIRGFEDIGYKNVSIDAYTSLKSLGITPEFIEGFKKIGFENISLDEATSLKAMGVTPAYVTEMKGKGFKSTDVNKYIELKNAFN